MVSSALFESRATGALAVFSAFTDIFICKFWLYVLPLLRVLRSRKGCYYWWQDWIVYLSKILVWIKENSSILFTRREEGCKTCKTAILVCCGYLRVLSVVSQISFCYFTPSELLCSFCVPVFMTGAVFSPRTELRGHQTDGRTQVLSSVSSHWLFHLALIDYLKCKTQIRC